jgi:hypothetical protein
MQEYWLYTKENYCDRLDAEVSRERNWPKGGTHNWSNASLIKGGLKAGLYKVAAPPEDIRNEIEKRCSPDLKVRINENNKLVTVGNNWTDELVQAFKAAFYYHRKSEF